MSKRSLGAKAAQKKGAETHKKERERHREKMRAKYDRYCKEIVKEGLLPAPYDAWIKWYEVNSSKPGNSISDVLTDIVNELGKAEEDDL